MRPVEFTKLRLCMIFAAVFLFMNSVLFSQSDSADKWTVAAMEFSVAKGQSSDSVISSMAKTLPSAILSKIGSTLERNVRADELYERNLQSVNENLVSLSVQLSSEIKKRDSLFLGNYSQGQLKSKLKDEDKKILDIQEKIKNALNEKSEIVEKIASYSEEYENSSDRELSEGEKWLYLIKNLFVKQDSLFSVENIVFYQDSTDALYNSDFSNPSDSDFISDARKKKINALITGEISAFSDFFSLSVKIYSYPLGRVIGEFVEVGALNDYELVASSAAQKIIPILTNAIPLNVNIKVFPDEAKNIASVFIDDSMVDFSSSVILDSGVHTILVSAQGYNTLSTSYFFEGNSVYNIEFSLERQEENFLKISTKKGNAGLFYLEGDILNSLESESFKESGDVEEDFSFKEDSSVTAGIKINGNNILGQFVSDGSSSFFYIPKTLSYDGSSVKINPKMFDRDEYVDSRRKIMYATYSIFIVSLIPTFYSYGNYLNQLKLYKMGYTDYDSAVKYQQTLNVCQGISIGCAVLWGYELFRYLLAANSVLPEKAVK